MHVAGARGIAERGGRERRFEQKVTKGTRGGRREKICKMIRGQND
jgi:hypothetical protein